MSESNQLSPLLDVLASLAAWLKEAGIRGAVIGGVAASLHGRPRMTQDVDAVIWLDTAQLQAFLDAGSRFGFKARISDAVEFAASNRVLLMTHEQSRTPVDITLGALPFEEEAIARASISTVRGVSFPVITPEDLVIMKAVAHRPRDMADIESVMDATPRIDMNRIRHWVGLFASALEAPEILDDLERIVSRYKPGSG